MSALILPRYCLVGARPVRALPTPDGGMTVEALDWKTGEFLRDLSWTERILGGHGEVDYLTEGEFAWEVARIRARIAAGGADRLYAPPGLHDWDRATREYLARQVPCPLSELTNPDCTGGGMALVSVDGDRRLYARGGVLMWVRVEGDRALSVSFPEGQEAVLTHAERGFVLPAERAAAIRAALVPGAALQPALDALWGKQRRGLRQQLREALTGGGARICFLVSHLPPQRAALLEVEEDAQGRVTRARLWEGVEGYKRLTEVLFFTGLWPMKPRVQRNPA
jgi:hypothetical protein